MLWLSKVLIFFGVFWLVCQWKQLGSTLGVIIFFSILSWFWKRIINLALFAFANPPRLASSFGISPSIHCRTDSNGLFSYFFFSLLNFVPRILQAHVGESHHQSMIGIIGLGIPPFELYTLFKSVFFVLLFLNGNSFFQSTVSPTATAASKNKSPDTIQTPPQSRFYSNNPPLWHLTGKSWWDIWRN